MSNKIRRTQEERTRAYSKSISNDQIFIMTPIQYHKKNLESVNVDVKVSDMKNANQEYLDIKDFQSRVIEEIKYFHFDEDNTKSIFKALGVQMPAQGNIIPSTVSNKGVQMPAQGNIIPSTVSNKGVQMPAQGNIIPSTVSNKVKVSDKVSNNVVSNDVDVKISNVVNPSFKNIGISFVKQILISVIYNMPHILNATLDPNNPMGAVIRTAVVPEKYHSVVKQKNMFNLMTNPVTTSVVGAAITGLVSAAGISTMAAGGIVLGGAGALGTLFYQFGAGALSFNSTETLMRDIIHKNYHLVPNTILSNKLRYIKSFNHIGFLNFLKIRKTIAQPCYGRYRVYTNRYTRNGSDVRGRLTLSYHSDLSQPFYDFYFLDDIKYLVDYFTNSAIRLVNNHKSKSKQTYYVVASNGLLLINHPKYVNKEYPIPFLKSKDPLIYKVVY